MTTKEITERHRCSARTLNIVAQNEGGVGKTYFASHLHAAFEILGLQQRFFDLDFGNRASSMLLPKVDAVPWGTQGSLAGMIMRDCAQADAVTVDVGANVLIDGEYKSLVDNLLEIGRSEGRITNVFVPVIPNKAGRGATPIAVADAFSNATNVALVLNDLDGSGNFPGLPDRFPALHLKHMESGFVSSRMAFQGSILDYILRGDERFSLARGHWAKYLLAFLEQPYMAGLLSALSRGTEGATLTLLRGMQGPGRSYTTIRTLAAATDVRLRANERCATSASRFFEGDKGTDFVERAAAFHDAYNALQA